MVQFDTFHILFTLLVIYSSYIHIFFLNESVSIPSFMFPGFCCKRDVDLSERTCFNKGMWFFTSITRSTVLRPFLYGSVVFDLVLVLVFWTKCSLVLVTFLSFLSLIVLVQF